MSTNYISEIKKHSILEYFSYEGISVTSNGKNYVACCPLHNEKTPSFQIKPDLDKWYCYGQCKKNGDLLDFICEYKQLEKSAAIEYLCKVFNIPYKVAKKSTKQSKVDEILHINQMVCDFYHTIFTNSPLGKSARNYFKKRLPFPELINEFCIGYAPDSSESGEWTYLTNYLSKNHCSAELATKLGLLRRSEKSGSLYDAFRGRLIFPVFSLSGTCLGFNTRILPEYEKPGTPKYLLSSESEVFKKSSVVYGYNKTLKPIKANNEVIHVEGVWDFLNLYARGFQNVIPHFGSPSFIPPVDNHIILMDPDSAGIKYSIDFGEKLLKEGKSPRICNIGHGKDPSDLSTEEIQSIIQSSQSFISAFMSLNYRYKDSIEHKMVILDRILKVLAGVSLEVMMVYCAEIALILSLPLDVVLFRASLEKTVNCSSIYKQLKTIRLESSNINI